MITITFGAVPLIEVFLERVLPTRACTAEAFCHGRHAARDYDTLAIVQSSVVAACAALLAASVVLPCWREAGAIAAWCIAWAAATAFLTLRAQRHPGGPL